MADVDDLRHALATISGHAAALRLQLEGDDVDVQACRDAVARIAKAAEQPAEAAEALLRSSARPRSS